MQHPHLHNHPIVFFDGVCNFCNIWVRLLLRLDSRQILLFAPLQGKNAQEKLSSQMDSIVFYNQNRIFTGAQAIFEIIRCLPFPWRLFSILQFLPARLNEGIYRLFASWRYRIFGKRSSCFLPTAPIKNRFLD